MNSPIFSISPFYAAADKNLGHAAHRVLTLLCGFADPEGLCFPSRKMLCALTGIENSNLSKYINVLCRKGYLAKTNAAGNRYKIIGFKDKQWPMLECGNDYHQENQQHGNSYHENSGDGNNYHERGNHYHEDGNHYHEKAVSVVTITNITDQEINRPLEQTNTQTSGVADVCLPVAGKDAVKTSSPKPAKKPKNEYSPEFEELWAIYPEGANNAKPDKLGTSRCLNARLNEGESLDVIRTGVMNYREFCNREGRTGGRFVANPTTFFGTQKRYLQYQVLTTTPTNKPGVNNGYQPKLSCGEITDRMFAQFAINQSKDAASHSGETGRVFSGVEYSVEGRGDTVDLGIHDQPVRAQVG